MIDWNKIKIEYITTNASYSNLAEKHGVSFKQICKVGSREKWVELRRQHRERTLKKTVSAVENAQVVRAKKILAVTDKLLRKIEETVDCEGAMTEKAIRALTAAVKDLREIQGIKSQLDTQEQEARIANLRRQAERAAEERTAFTVTLEGETEEYVR